MAGQNIDMPRMPRLVATSITAPPAWALIQRRLIALMEESGRLFARQYFERGKRLIPLVSSESRACPSALHQVYSAILDRIESSGFEVFEGRIGLSTPLKLYIMAKLWAGSLTPTVPLLRR